MEIVSATTFHTFNAVKGWLLTFLVYERCILCSAGASLAWAETWQIARAIYSGRIVPGPFSEMAEAL
jgi:hypothetical protein